MITLTLTPEQLKLVIDSLRLAPLEDGTDIEKGYALANELTRARNANAYAEWRKDFPEEEPIDQGTRAQERWQNCYSKPDYDADHDHSMDY